MASLRGNPLRGYRADGLSIEREGAVLASGEAVEIHLSLRSLMAGEVAISLLRLKGLSLDLSCLSPSASSGCPTLPQGIRRLEIIEAHLLAPGGEAVDVARGTWDSRSDGAVVEAEGRLRGLPFRGKLRLLQKEGRLSLEEGSLSLGNSRLQLAGTLTPLALSGRASPLDLSELSLLFPGVTGAGLSGRPDVTFSLGGEGPSTLSGTLHLPRGQAVGIALDDFRARWTWKERHLSFAEIASRANGSPVRGDLDLDFGGERLALSIDLEGENLDIGSWQKAFPWLSFASGSLAAIAVDLKGPTSNLAGRVRFVDAEAFLAGQKASAFGAELLLDGRGSISLRGSGRWVAAPVDVAGTVALDDRTTLDLRFSTNALVLHRLRARFGWLEALLPEGDLAGTMTLRGPAASPAYEGTIRSDKIRLCGKPLGNFEARFSVRNGDAVIEKIRGEWEGAVVEGAGIVSLFGTATPSLALTGRVRDLALGLFVPDGFDVGDSQGSWKLEGPLDRPLWTASLSVDDVALGGIRGGPFAVEARYDGKSLALDALSGPLLGGEITGRGKIELTATPSMKLQGDFLRLPLAEKALEGTIAEGSLSSSLSGGYLLEGPLAGPKLLLHVREGRATAWSVPVEAVEGRFSLDGDRLVVERASLALLGGKASLSGSFRKETGAAIEVRLDGLDMTTFPGRNDLAFTVGGLLSGSARLSGTGKTVQLETELTVPTFKVGDFSLSDVALQARADRERLEITAAKGQIGTSALEARGSFALDPLRGSFSLAGKKLDLAVFASAADPKRTGGLFDISLDAQLGTTFSATGSLTSPSLRLGGLRLDDLQIPFLVLDRYLTIEEGKGTFYGGAVETQWSLGLDEEIWGGNLSVRGFDLAPALADGLDLEGSFSGKTDLQISLSGTYGRAMLLDGRGNLTVADGQAEGFSALSKAGGPIPYRSLAVNYVIDGKTLYLLPGSRAAAPSGNGLYRYLSFDGDLTPGKDLDIACYGEVNLQAFSALLGAFSKLALAETSQAMVKGFLSGLLGNVTGRDFREVSLRLVGDWETPLLKDFTIRQSQQRSTPIPSGASDPKDRSDAQQFTFRLEFPTGQGVRKGSSEMGSQITQQILDQILIQILGTDDEAPDDGSFYN
ncbi:hypothetical protein KAR29_00335 [Aminithiophilus ramosus]|uniref:Translocation and assembly module TamB n=1 Tax=Aminithiophilus ramosus TaxID=3029084 RepID=A0A9Q7AFV0_9BACT|nr:hypothetical protein [Aminithiophilus ramosus]QTX32434.1 hypothetical protein KAR29_00335 [Aminithiophilus ramosus]